MLKKIELKKKDILQKVKINNFNLDMQIDTGCEVTLIPKYSWERIGKPTLRLHNTTRQLTRKPISFKGKAN